jgi:hypothetical protein
MISFQMRGVELYIGEQMRKEIAGNDNLLLSLTTNSVVMNANICVNDSSKTNHYKTKDCKLNKILDALPTFNGNHDNDEITNSFDESEKVDLKNEQEEMKNGNKANNTDKFLFNLG